MRSSQLIASRWMCLRNNEGHWSRHVTGTGRLSRTISVNAVSYKDASAKQTQNCGDYFNHLTDPHLQPV
jgi:hypothetical protein